MKESMAEVEQILRQDDVYQGIDLESPNVAGVYMAEHGNAILFKDGSTLEYADEMQAGTLVNNPERDVEIILTKHRKLKGDMVYRMAIKDDEGTLSITENGGGVHMRHNSSLPLDMSKEQVAEYLKERNVHPEVLDGVLKTKNEVSLKDTITGFLNRFKEKKPEQTEIDKNHRNKNRI